MICINDYILNPSRLNKKKRLEWYDLWVNKSDYITEYYGTIKGKYDLIDESIDYYIAMLESSIYFMRNYKDYYGDIYIQHNNRMEIKEDIKERDFAEYIKYLFYYDYDINYVYELIEKGKYKFNYDLVVARLLFPSYYLYYFEMFIIYNTDYDKLEDVVSKSTSYEIYLKKVVNKINENCIKKIVLPF